MQNPQYSYYRWVIQSILFLIQIGLGLNFMAPSPLFLSIMENYDINKGIVGLFLSSGSVVMGLFLLPGGFLILQINEIKITKTKKDVEKELKKLIKASKNYQLNQYSKIYFNRVKEDIEINEI